MSAGALGRAPKRQFIRPTVTVGLPPMPTGEPIRVHTSPLSEMEIIREMNISESHNAAGPREISPSFFKNDGEVLIS